MKNWAGKLARKKLAKFKGTALSLGDVCMWVCVPVRLHGWPGVGKKAPAEEDVEDVIREVQRILGIVACGVWTHVAPNTTTTPSLTDVGTCGSRGAGRVTEGLIE